MGCVKALLPIDGVPLIAAHVQGMAGVCEGVRVVLGAHRAAIDGALPPHVARIDNPQWAATGPRDSLLLALADLPGDALALVCPVDTPPAPPAVLAALLVRGAPAVPTWRGTDGHPALLVVGPARAALQAGGTLRDALRSAVRVPVDWPDAPLNLNTPQQWTAWRQRS